MTRFFAVSPLRLIFYILFAHPAVSHPAAWATGGNVSQADGCQPTASWDVTNMTLKQWSWRWWGWWWWGSYYWSVQTVNFHAVSRGQSAPQMEFECNGVTWPFRYWWSQPQDDWTPTTWDPTTEVDIPRARCRQLGAGGATVTAGPGEGKLLEFKLDTPDYWNWHNESETHNVTLGLRLIHLGGCRPGIVGDSVMEPEVYGHSTAACRHVPCDQFEGALDSEWYGTYCPGLPLPDTEWLKNCDDWMAWLPCFADQTCNLTTGAMKVDEKPVSGTGSLRRTVRVRGL